MNKRSEQEWLSLFKQHDESGLTAAAFCRENRLCAKYFSKRKLDLNWKAERLQGTQSFIRVNRPKSRPTQIEMKVGELQLSLPDSVEANWLAKLV
ncbi:IS66 family insertion sequence element accessory protein TnpA [Aliikangiella sp. IMCC44359]